MTPPEFSSSVRSALIALSTAGFLLVAYLVRTVVVGRRTDGRIARVGRSPIASMWTVEAFYWLLQAPGRWCHRLGVSPDVLTWTSLVLGLASLPSLVLGHFTTAGVLFIASTVADALDGMVARLSGQASNSGEVLDAVIDRYVDAAPLLGLAIYYRDSLLEMSVPLAALVGSFMLSYNRAKAETFGLELPSTAMRRHERTIFIACSLILGPAVATSINMKVQSVPVLALIALMAVLSNFAAMKLAAQARAALRQRESEARDAQSR